ncbi:MAG: esterase [Clostridia bacterium]|nr:esterase [Clostridia bacterium]
MNISYYKRYSPSLGRDMEFKVYGSGGKPVIAIPCQGGRFYEFEDMRMLDVYAPYIEGGDIQVFTIDSLDGETLSASGDPHRRITRHESWIHYIVYEALPEFASINGTGYKFGVCGLSLGALHAATLMFRFPDKFDMLLALSGVYTNEYFFGAYHDRLTYENSPQQFIANMPCDHPYINMYNDSRIVLCVGQGAWENETLESTRIFGDILKSKGIEAWVDFWGNDVKHDWDWWYVQAAYFLPKLLDK